MSDKAATMSLHELELELEANRLKQQQRAAALALLAHTQQPQKPEPQLLAPSPVSAAGLLALSKANAAGLPPLAPGSINSSASIAAIDRRLQSLKAIDRRIQALEAAGSVRSLEAQLVSSPSLQQQQQAHHLAILSAAGSLPSTIPSFGAAVGPSHQIVDSILAARAKADAARASATFRNAIVQHKDSFDPVLQLTSPAAVPAGILRDNALAKEDKICGSPSTTPQPAVDGLTRKRRGGISDPFPVKLHRILSEVEREGRSDIVSWLPHGRAFALRKPEEFASEIMPRYFPRMSSLSSLHRQFNLYNFKRITEGRDKGAYYHSLFLKGRPDLVRALKRTKSKSTFVHTMGADGRPVFIPRGLASLYEPNFYKMPPLQESLEDCSSLQQQSHFQ